MHKPSKIIKNKTKTKSSSKKKAATARNTSSKRAKKFVKNVKYASPTRFVAQENTCQVQSNLNNFRKQYLNKRAWDSKCSSNDTNSKKAKKSLSKKRKPVVAVKKTVLPGQNIKMKTINLGESRNHEEISAHSSGSYVFNISDANASHIKKSATMKSLFEANQIPASQVAKKPFINHSSSGNLNFYN